MENPDPTTKVLLRRTARAIATVCVAGAISFVGCTAQVETARPVVATDDADLVAVDTVPADISSYPHVDYRGRPVYYVNGRWYSSSGQRWYYYRNEPADLVRHRRYVETAPPAPRASPYAPAPGYAPAPTYAPPRTYAPSSSYAPPSNQSAPDEAVRVR